MMPLSMRPRASSMGGKGQILVVDDDPVFTMTLSRIAALRRLPVVACDTVNELCELDWRDFSLALVDYDLGSFTGVDVITYLADVAPSLPIVLISQRELPFVTSLPRCVAGFVPKAGGPKKVLEWATRLVATKPLPPPPPVRTDEPRAV